jgi:ABC-type amino acid transport substrate-binding protein
MTRCCGFERSSYPRCPARSRKLTIGRRAWLISALICGWIGSIGTASADYAGIIGSRVLKVAVYKDFFPFSGLERSEPRGLDVALARALAQELGVNLSLMPFDAGETMSDDLRNMVWRGHYLGYGPADVMLHVPLDRRLMAQNDRVLILAPYYREQVVLVHDRRHLPAVTGIVDLIGLTIATDQGSSAAHALLAARELRDRIRLMPTGSGAIEALVEERVDAAMVTRAQAEAALQASGAAMMNYTFTMLELPALPAVEWAVGMAIKANDAALANALAGALESLRRSHALERLYEGEGVTLVNP